MSFYCKQTMNVLGPLKYAFRISVPQIFRSLSTTLKRKDQPTDNSLTIKSQEGGIRTICLNDPKKRNALSLAMLQSLYEDLKNDEDNLRVIIIKATGPVFSSGHDLKELTAEKGSEFHEKVFSTCTEVMNLIQDLPVPVIAQVNGLATAAGCQLVAACDLAVASQSSKFATPGVNVGLFCTTPGVALSRSVCSKVALEMLLTGNPISATEALLHGLISKVVPDDQVETETLKLANRICETSKEVVALGKKAFYTQILKDTKNAYRYAESVMVSNLTLKDGNEGIKAFIEKRKPSWKN
ncbi:enoyl-CoA hydratase domain-containing protein 3, mitochondrial-like isoform X2 [Biomphalaria glabrata]|uniref:Enoyl-CoA hydratase domain-containing protein 3, mitochondrial n=1 Tax=Biomphalaria glabrata TaxID=6526 RepID=A0A9W2Z7D1_BIOGL|nr:enoyl-CoA hydratase domain-containing protein 3, mitochondrial-like isoform X2 [Biomphalaria glabrata]